MTAAAAPSSRSGRSVALAPLRHRNYALVWTAGLVSNVGTWMETVAVGSLVAGTTGKAGWTTLVAAAGFLPMGLLGPVGGAFADRFDRRHMLIAMTAAQMVCALGLTLLAATDHATVGPVAVLVFVAGCVAGVGFPAYAAMLPDLVPKEDLLAAMSLSQAQWNFGRVIGPPLAGLAILLGSYTTAFAFNFVSFLAMLVALRLLRLEPHVAPTDQTPLVTRIVVGAKAAHREPGVWSAIVMISVVGLTASPFIALIPAMAEVRFHGNSTLTAWFTTAQGVGAVAGAFALPMLAARFGRYRVLLWSFVLLPVALVLYGASPGPAYATAALVGVGASYMFVFSGIGTVAQLRAPAEVRARVLSFYFLALGVMYPVGSLIQGPVADRIGLGVMTALSGVLLLGAVALIRTVRPARITALDDPEPEVAAALGSADDAVRGTIDGVTAPPPPPSSPAPGWYPDPWYPGMVRWFDGVAWTEHASPGGTQVGWGDVYDGAKGASTAKLAAIAFVGRGAVAAFQAVASALLFSEMWDDLFEALDDPEAAQTATFGSSATLLSLVSQLLSLVTLAALVILCIWTFRATKNARALGLRTAISPGWAVAGWIIPLANFVMPFLSVRDLFPPGHPARRRAGVWWACEIAGVILTIAAAVVAAASTAGALVVAAVAGCSMLAAGVLGMRLARTADAAHASMAAGHAPV